MSETAGQRKVDYQEFSALKQDITDMKSLMSRMVEAISRISIIEERQHAQAQATNKVLERIDAITAKQHEHEVANAANHVVTSRVEQMERAFRELHVENERNKARFQTTVWLVRGLWAVVASGGLLWLFQITAHIPAK